MPFILKTETENCKKGHGNVLKFVQASISCDHTQWNHCKHCKRVCFVSLYRGIKP